MYRCAIVGASGSRAAGHAAAYAHVTRGKLVAISARNAAKRDALGEKFGVAARYDDYREMFRKERPDLVHVNTPAHVRAEVIEAAQELGVRSLIVEKPIGVQGEDFRELAALAGRVTLRVAVNHQLHFHPCRAALQRRVAAGEIGTVRLIDATARLNLAAQGTHMLQAIGAFNGAGRPTGVLAQAAGGKGLAPNPRSHFAPDDVLADIAYDNGSRAILRCGPGAPVVRATEAPPYNKRISVYGSAGAAHWTMWGWEFVGADGRREAGEHDYFEQDAKGQAAMTEAMFDWLEDPAKAHPLNLAAALSDFNVILGIYQSVLERRAVALPADPGAGLIDRLRQTLGT